jgi:hypothetical protein
MAEWEREGGFSISNATTLMCIILKVICEFFAKY